jgi:hypothetical protein
MDVLHAHEVRGPDRSHLVHLGDVRMSERSGKARLREKALHERTLALAIHRDALQDTQPRDTTRRASRQKHLGRASRIS